MDTHAPQNDNYKAQNNRRFQWMDITYMEYKLTNWATTTINWMFNKYPKLRQSPGQVKTARVLQNKIKKKCNKGE